MPVLEVKHNITLSSTDSLRQVRVTKINPTKIANKPSPRTFLILWSFCGRVSRMTKHVLIRSTREWQQNDLESSQRKYYGELLCSYWGINQSNRKTKINTFNKLVPWSFWSEWECSGQLEGEVCTAPKGLHFSAFSSISPTLFIQLCYKDMYHILLGSYYEKVHVSDKNLGGFSRTENHMYGITNLGNEKIRK